MESLEIRAWWIDDSRFLNGSLHDLMMAWGRPSNRLRCRSAANCPPNQVSIPARRSESPDWLDHGSYFLAHRQSGVSRADAIHDLFCWLVSLNVGMYAPLIFRMLFDIKMRCGERRIWHLVGIVIIPCRRPPRNRRLSIGIIRRITESMH